MEVNFADIPKEETSAQPLTEKRHHFGLSSNGVTEIRVASRLTVPSAVVVESDLVDSVALLSGESEYRRYIEASIGLGERANVFIPPKTSDDPLVSGTWARDSTSGRSFWFRDENVGISIVQKGVNYIRNGSIRAHNYDGFKGELTGFEVIDNLSQEFDAALILQEVANKVFNRPTWTPLPLALCRMTHALNPINGKVDRIEDFVLKMAEQMPSSRQGMAHAIALRAGGNTVSTTEKIDISPELQWDNQALTSEYLRITGGLGAYQYALNGANTRVFDLLYYPRDLGEALLLREYGLDKLEPESILTRFSERLGETSGILHALGLGYVFGSNCLALDTTIGGISVDLCNVGDLRGAVSESNLQLATSMRFLESASLIGHFAAHFWKELACSNKPFKKVVDVIKTSYVDSFRKAGISVARFNGDAFAESEVMRFARFAKAFPFDTVADFLSLRLTNADFRYENRRADLTAHPLYRVAGSRYRRSLIDGAIINSL